MNIDFHVLYHSCIQHKFQDCWYARLVLGTVISWFLFFLHGACQLVGDRIKQIIVKDYTQEFSLPVKMLVLPLACHVIRSDLLNLSITFFICKTRMNLPDGVGFEIPQDNRIEFLAEFQGASSLG